MYVDLVKLSERPKLFSVYTADTLWTDPHLSSQMLQLHLSQDTALASRPVEAIDRVVEMIDQSVHLAGKSVCDLGCGPGLYAERFAERGAIVQGLDFSPGSIAYAQSQRSAQSRSLTYQVANYLKDPLPPHQDVITLIYCDLCPLSPHQRVGLLANIRHALAPGGQFILDVFSLDAGDAVEEGVSFGRNYMNSFWSAGDYFAFQHTFKYDAEAVSLDRYTIIEPDRTWQVYNWLTYFTKDQIRTELEQAGFKHIVFTDGFGVDPTAETSFGIIASA